MDSMDQLRIPKWVADQKSGMVRRIVCMKIIKGSVKCSKLYVHHDQKTPYKLIDEILCKARVKELLDA